MLSFSFYFCGSLSPSCLGFLCIESGNVNVTQLIIVTMIQFIHSVRECERKLKHSQTSKGRTLSFLTLFFFIIYNRVLFIRTCTMGRMDNRMGEKGSKEENIPVVLCPFSHEQIALQILPL